MPRLSPAAVLLVFAACASGGQSSGRQGFLLTPEDWAGASAANALEAIVLLRPTWLGSRANVEDDRAVNCVEVFENNRPVGSRDALTRYQLAAIQSIRYIPKGNPRPGDAFSSMQNCVAIQIRT